MSKYGFIVENGGLVCAPCSDNLLDNEALEAVESKGYPDGYTCADCGIIVEGESK